MLTDRAPSAGTRTSRPAAMASWTFASMKSSDPLLYAAAEQDTVVRCSGLSGHRRTSVAARAPSTLLGKAGNSTSILVKPSLMACSTHKQ